MKTMTALSAQSPFPDGRRIPFGILCARKLPLVVLVTVASCILLFAFYGFPIPDGDAAYYWPPMLAMAKTGELINDFSTEIRTFDPAGHNRLVYHGYLYPLLVGKIIWKADYGAIALLVALINVVTLSATTFLLLIVSYAGRVRIPLREAITISVAIPACAVTLMGHSGRAETLGAPILVLAMIGILCLERRWHVIILGVVIGLLVGTHPMGCILTAAVVAFRVFYSMQFWDGIRFLCKVVLLGVAIWGATFALYPYSLHDWLVGLLQNGRNVLPPSESESSRLWSAWITSPGATAYGLIYMLAGIAGGYSLVRGWRSMKCRIPCFVCGLLLVAAVVNYGFRNPGQNSTLLLFAPLVICFVVWNNARWSVYSGSVRFLWGAVTACCLFAAAAGFMRTSLLFPYYLKDGLGREAGKREFAAVREKYGGSIQLSSGLFSLTDDYQHVNDAENGNGAKYETMVLQQANHGLLVPPTIDGYELVKHQFSSVQPRLFGLKLGNTVGGYNFAVYRLKGGSH